MKCAMMTGLILAAAASRADLPAPLIRYQMDELVGNKIRNAGSAANADLEVGARCRLVDRAVSGRGLQFCGVAEEGSAASFQCPALGSRTVSFWMFRENAVSDFQSKKTSNCLPWLVANASRLSIRLAESSQTSLNNDAIVPFIGTGDGTYMNRGSSFAVRGAWVHVALTINEKSLLDGVSTFDWTFYANGEIDASGTDYVATNIAEATTCVLGNQGIARPFYGTLDEFRIYGCALTHAQVKEEFEAYANGVSTVKLVGHWPCDEWTASGTGFVTPDRSNYAKDLFISAGTAAVDGPFGKCIEFKGLRNTYATVRIAKKLTTASWSFWFRQSPDSENIKIPDVARKNVVLIMLGKFFSMLDIGFAQRRWVYQVQRSTPDSRALVNPAVLHQGVWQHAVFVNRGTQDAETGNYAVVPELWINGRFVGRGVAEESDAFAIAANEPLFVGNSSDSANASFEGFMDDLRVYSGALSSNDIVRIYRGVAKPTVPAAYSVKGNRTVLCGQVATAAGEPYRVGYNGQVTWSCVARPDGAAEPAFARADNAVTEVALPAEGAYTFRLTVRDELGGENHADVDVVRDDSAGGLSPSVPDAGLDVAASDAVSRSTLSSGLIRHWTGAGSDPEREAVLNGKSLDIGWRDDDLNRLGSGDGIAPYAYVIGCPTNGLSMGESPETADASGGNSGWPKDEWRTFSLWMYQDEEMSRRPHYSPCIVSSRFTIYVDLNKWTKPGASGLVNESGIQICQVGGIRSTRGWSQSSLWYPAPFSFTNRWTHLVVAINRHDSAKMEVWLDGAKQTPTEVSIAQLSGENCGGRLGENWMIGGINYKAVDYTSESNELYSVAYDRPGGTMHTRSFPGKLTDIRLYDRQLSAAEVGYLYRHPGTSANMAPAVSKAVLADASPVARTPDDVAALAADDGGTTGLVYEWTVVGGDAAKLSFADRTARETTVTANAAGTYSVCLKVSDGERVTYGEPVEFTVLRRGTVLILR